MDFSLTEEQNMLRDSAVKFVRDSYSYEDRQKLVHNADGYSKDNWSTFAELGWLCIPFSEDDGGIGGGPVETMIMMEEFGKGLVVEPFLPTVVLAGGVLSRAANAEQKAKHIGGIVEGQSVISLAYAEATSGYDLNDVSTVAVKQGDGYVLNGAKSYVLAGAAADTFIVVARTSGEQCDEKGVSLFLVDAKTSGLTVQACKSLDGHRTAELTLDNVNVSADALLGVEGEAVSVLESAVHDAVLALSAEAVGMMEKLYQETIEYTKQRKQFGLAISNFQVLQHRMVDMFTMHTQCKSLLLRAVLSSEANNEEASKDLAALKYAVGIQGQKVAHEAVQIFGGMGMTDEMSIGMYLKRINVISMLLGDTDYYLQKFIDA